MAGLRGGSGGGGSGKAGASAVRAGGAYYEVVGKDGLSNVLDKLQKRIAGFGAFTRQVGGATLGAGLALATPLAALFRSGVNRAADIQKMAETFGVATESVGKFAGAVETAGGTLGDVESILSTATERNKGRMPLDKYLELVSIGLSKIDDPARRAEAAVDALGAAGHKLLPLLSNPEKLKRLMGDAPGVDAAAGREAVKTQEALAAASLHLRSALLPLAQGVLPVVRAVADFARENANLLRVVGTLGAGLVALGTALSATGAGVGLALKAWGLFGPALGIVVKVLGMLLSPLALAAGGVAALGALFVTQTAAGREMGEALGAMTSGVAASFARLAAGVGQAFKNLYATFNEAWQGITDAIKGGDLELAFKIAAVGIKAVWFGMLQDMGKAFAEWVEENRHRIVALGAVLGAMKGGGIGGRFGPWGLGIGAVAGGVGGGFGADAIADTLKGFGDGHALDAKRKAAEAELKKLVGQAHKVAEAAKQGEPGHHQGVGALRRPFEAVKGGFNANAAGRQFAFGDTVEAKQLAVLIGIQNGNGQLPQKIGQAVANGFRLK